MVESQTVNGTFTPFNQAKTGTTELVAVIVVVALVAAFLIIRRRRPRVIVPTKLNGRQTEVVESNPAVVPPLTAQASLPTGYSELDFLLGGGLPLGYAVVFVSPPFDEVDLIFGKIIGSALSSGHSAIFLSSHLGRSQYLASRYTKGFYVLSSQADKINPRGANTFKVAGIDNLTDLNVSFNKATHAIPKLEANTILIIDLLPDVLLQHKGLAARKWLDEFLASRKAEGYTILASLNPLVSTSQENQTVIDLFDGVIEIYEKKVQEIARRFLIIKRMYGRKYMDTELMLDKKRLF
jgi:KaiC/GvpD/RAD55 family RecA-like ATPase